MRGVSDNALVWSRLFLLPIRDLRWIWNQLTPQSQRRISKAALIVTLRKFQP